MNWETSDECLNSRMDDRKQWAGKRLMNVEVDIKAQLENAEQEFWDRLTNRYPKGPLIASDIGFQRWISITYGITTYLTFDGIRCLWGHHAHRDDERLIIFKLKYS